MLFEYNNEHTYKYFEVNNEGRVAIDTSFFMQNTQTVVQKHITGFTITFVWRSKQSLKMKKSRSCGKLIDNEEETERFA